MVAFAPHPKNWGQTPISAASGLEEVGAVVDEFVDGLVDIGQGGVGLALFEGIEDLRFPAPGQFLQGADIEIAVMQPGFELGHVLHQKTAILADGVATQRRGSFGDIGFDEINDLLLGLGFGQRGRLDFVDQAAFAVGALVPGVHGIEHRIALVDDPHRPLDAGFKLRPGDNHSDFQQALFFRVQTRHLAIDPDQIQVRLGQAGGHCRRGHRGIAHPAIVADAHRVAGDALNFKPCKCSPTPPGP